MSCGVELDRSGYGKTSWVASRTRPAAKGPEQGLVRMLDEVAHVGLAALLMRPAAKLGELGTGLEALCSETVPHRQHRRRHRHPCAGELFGGRAVGQDALSQDVIQGKFPARACALGDQCCDRKKGPRN